MGIAKGTNMVMSFVLELAALGALAYWGSQTGQGLMWSILLGGGAPLLAAVVWGLFAAPRAAVRVPSVVRMGVELAFFTLATAALWAAGQPTLAAVFGVVALISWVLSYLWQQRQV
ncbi:MAG: YrdB family protein [Chloroflexota bacterium]|nr:YrdB family protein [Chloroflexota bacterium]